MAVHPIYRVVSFEIVAPYTLLVRFDDGSEQRINFGAVLSGEIYGPLRRLSLFNQVRLDPDTRTLIWPNGADFDPATLHDWPTYAYELAARADRWRKDDLSTRFVSAHDTRDSVLRLREDGACYDLAQETDPHDRTDG
jgi:hypothetical protein